MRVGSAGAVHLILFGLVLPYLAFKTSRVLATRPLPPKEKFLASQIMTLAFFLVLSVLLGRLEWVTLFPPAMPSASSFGLGAATLVVMIALLRPLWRKRVEERSRKVWLYMPRTPKERNLWIGCSIAAGISEEVTYRGVMFALLWRLSGSAWAAALVSAAVFSISHMAQGPRSMAIIFVMALAFQGLTWVTGSLYVGMAVHALYDIAAGLGYAWYGEKLDYPVEPMPA